MTPGQLQGFRDHRMCGAGLTVSLALLRRDNTVLQHCRSSEKRRPWVSTGRWARCHGRPCCELLMPPPLHMRCAGSLVPVFALASYCYV